MATIANLSIGLSADSAKLKKDLDKASGHSKKWARGQKKQFASVEKSIRGIGVAIAAIGFGAMLRGAAQTAKQLKIMSDLTGVSTTKLQQIAPSLDRAGISTEKYADIIKDVNDKMHDFQQTGGGPMADFFEEIAPKIGLTADAFEKLSGPDALQLYVSSLEKAGLSQEQMTFYMEALASDSTMLLPLIRDNAKGMNEFALATEQALRPEVLKALTDISVGLVTLGTSLRNLIFNAFGPFITILADSLRGLQRFITDFPKAATAVGVLTTAVLALTVAMYANPIGLLVAGLAALVTSAGYVYDKLTLIKDATGSWAEAFTLMSEAVGFAFGTIKAYGERLRLNLALSFNGIKNDWVDLVGEMKIAFAQMVDSFAGTSLGSMLGIEGGNTDAARSNYAAAINGVTDEFVVLMEQQGANEARINAENPALSKLAELLKPAIESNTNLSTGGIFSRGSGGAGAAGGSNKKAKSLAESVTTNLMDKLGLKLGEVKPYVDLATSFVDTLQSSFSTLLKTGDIKGFFTSVLDSFTSNVIDSFTEGLFAPLQESLTTSIGEMFAKIGQAGAGGGGGFLSSAIGWLGGFFGAADGGIVPTTPFSKSYADSVPTMLQPGELVVPKDQVGNFMGGGGGQTFNINVSGDVSRATRSEIVKMMPEIAAGTNMLNRENNVKR